MVMVLVFDFRTKVAAFTPTEVGVKRISTEHPGLGGAAVLQVEPEPIVNSPSPLILMPAMGSEA
jgi:hypothetical protein